MKLIKWEKLNSDQQMDIVENIYHNIPYLEDNWNIWSFREYLDNEIGFQIPMIVLEVKTAMKDVVKLWSRSSPALKQIRNYDELYPVIAVNGKFFDGGHRMTVANERGFKKMYAYELGGLINYDWQKYFDEGLELPEPYVDKNELRKYFPETNLRENIEKELEIINYYKQIETADWSPLTSELYKNISDEGWMDELDDFDGTHYVYFKLQIADERTSSLMSFDDETIELFNSFDIFLKSKQKHPYQIIDFIDYESGTIYILKHLKPNSFK